VGGFPDLAADEFDRVMAAIVSTVRASGGAGAWDFTALDERAYGPGDT